MTDSADPHLWHPAQAREQATNRPAPPRPKGPVLMGDAAAQIGGTPLLLHLWRDWQDEDDA